VARTIRRPAACGRPLRAVDVIFADRHHVTLHPVAIGSLDRPRPGKPRCRARKSVQMQVVLSGIGPRETLQSPSVSRRPSVTLRPRNDRRRRMPQKPPQGGTSYRTVQATAISKIGTAFPTRRLALLRHCGKRAETRFGSAWLYELVLPPCIKPSDGRIGLVRLRRLASVNRSSFVYQYRGRFTSTAQRKLFKHLIILPQDTIEYPPRCRDGFGQSAKPLAALRVQSRNNRQLRAPRRLCLENGFNDRER